MTRYKFKSVFANELQNYLDEKIKLGYEEKSYLSFLKRFDQFLIKEDIKEPIFTAEHAARWIVKKTDEADTTHYSRVNAIKHFLEYLRLKNYDVYVTRDIKYKGTDFEPHIYTDDEVNRYFFAVDSYSSPANRMDAIQYPVLFRILYCCGTRINETLGIRKKDVDLEGGIILLNETKNNKQRYVVMGDDLLELFKSFANKRFYMLNDNDYIFTNAVGKRIDEKTVYDKHREFLNEAGIPYIGDREGPRIHDWRHTMAVYSFKKLADSGLDMYVALPILSAYLGHKTICATERYVRLTIQLFPYIEEKFLPTLEKVFDDISKEGDVNEDY